jgi:ABC-2 type transport system ATP-binding protein
MSTSGSRRTSVEQEGLSDYDQRFGFPSGVLMIEVVHLTKRYGPFTAVDDVSFKAERGEILGLLGPNGAGKTTTMRVLTGYMPASEGSATVAGHDVFANPIEAKRKIGYLPETPPLYPDMTVREYLTFVGKLKLPANVSKAERTSRVDNVMAKTHITDMANRHCSKLSKGYKQRVGIAQALIHDPEVLVLDEPTAGLDPKQILETRDLVRSLAGNHTVVLSTHILPEVSQTCQRVVIINKGRVVAVDTPDNLTRQLKGSASVYVQVDAGGDDASAALSALSGVRQVSETDRHEQLVGFEVAAEMERDIRRDVARLIVDRGWGLLELRPMRLSLEDIFLQLTTDEKEAAPPAATTDTVPESEQPHA